MSIRKVITATIFFFLTAGYASAGSLYAAGDVKRIRLDSSGMVYFGVTPQPSETCSNWGEYLKFDYTTPQGSGFLSTLLTAKAAGKIVSIWYNSSTAPGTDQTTGCDASATSLMTGIGIN